MSCIFYCDQRSIYIYIYIYICYIYINIYIYIYPMCHHRCITACHATSQITDDNWRSTTQSVIISVIMSIGDTDYIWHQVAVQTLSQYIRHTKRDIMNMTAHEIHPIDRARHTEIVFISNIANCSLQLLETWQHPTYITDGGAIICQSELLQRNLHSATTSERKRGETILKVFFITLLTGRRVGASNVNV